MHKWSERIAALRAEPSISEINDVVSAFNADRNLSTSSSRPIVLEFLSTLLSYTVPQVYGQLPQDSKAAISKSLQTMLGVSTLLSKISLAASDPDSRLLTNYGEILSMTFDQQLVPKLVRQSRGIAELTRIDHLFFKGGVWGVVNLARHSKSIPAFESGVFRSAFSFNTYLSMALAELLAETDLDLDSSFLCRLYGSFMTLSRDSVRDLFRIVFTPEHWPKFITLLEKMKRFQRKDTTIKLLTGFLPSLLSESWPESVRSQRIQAFGNLLVCLKPSIDGQVLEEILVTMNASLNLLVAYLISGVSQESYRPLTNNAVASWADPYIIKTEPIPRQQNRTVFLFELISQSPDPTFAKQLLSNPMFLTAVSTRLESYSDQVKNLGIYLANRVCELAGQDVIFKDEQNTHNAIPPNIPPLGQMPFEQCWTIVSSPSVIEASTSTAIPDFARMAVSHPESTSDSDDEDPGTYSNEKTVPAPVYIKTLLEYLLVSVEKEQAYEMRRVALACAPTLLRQKSSFGSEVAFYAQDLFTQLVALSNHFNDKGFAQSKLQCMIAVLVACPGAAVHACRLMLVGDYSLQQRMELLSSISLAVRELRGYHDPIVTESFTPSTFPTNTLPTELHQQLLGGDKDPSYDTAAYRVVQDTLMAEAAEEARDEVSGGKVLRVSRRLVPRDPALSIKPSRPDFYKTVAADFFFPLLAVWYEAGTIDIGHYSTVFVAHYIRTVSLIMHAAYPAAPTLVDMTREYFQLVIPLMPKISPQEIQVIESISTGMMLVCEITESDVLASRYHGELELTQQWLHQCWEEIIDERVRSLCAGLMLRISHIMNTFQRTISDDLNGFYN